MSVLIPTDFRHGWAIFGPLTDKNTWKVVLLELPASEKFSGLFCTCYEISVWNLAYIYTTISSGWCHMSSSSFIPIWTLWPTLQPKIGQSHVSAFMALKIRGLRFGTHIQILSVLTPICFCHAWAFFGPLVDKNTRKGELIELPASDTWGLSFIRIGSLPLKSFLAIFLNVLPYQLESWFIHWVSCTTYWVHVSLEWDPCDLHFLSLGTVN